MRKIFLFVQLLLLWFGCAGDELSEVPGVVIDHIPARTESYIGSPSIAVLPDGSYLASHDIFGPGSTQDQTVIFRSEDQGNFWEEVAQIDGQWWSNLFVHEGVPYIMGPNKRHGYVVIRRSDDRGEIWTNPTDTDSGLLVDDGEYHTAPVPVKIHNGRIWRAMENTRGPGGWPEHFQAFVMSAPVEANLLDATSWTISEQITFDSTWIAANDPGWLEGNIVISPDGEILNILRVNDDVGGTAAIIHVSDDGRELTFDPETDFIEFPGGRAKFTIRLDPVSGRYWSLVNKQKNPEAYRNILALISSENLREWTVESIILRHDDPDNHAFQYVDWLFEGDDIIAVSRTAWDGSHRAHDANYMTFHRIRDFRERILEEPPLNE